MSDRLVHENAFANADGTRAARRWLIRGKVQGVGFRPTVARCAARLRLDGAVANVADGVLVELEGDHSALASFEDCLLSSLPPQAEIASMESEPLAVNGRPGFALRESITDDGGRLRTRVPPDVRVCDACLAEVRGTAPRRGGYAFVSCVDCGPRYSIVAAMPFDRERTSMSRFTPCPDCAAEYGNASDRRFHSQTNACWHCGPQIEVRRHSIAAMTHPIANLMTNAMSNSMTGAISDSITDSMTKALSNSMTGAISDSIADSLSNSTADVSPQGYWLDVVAAALKAGAVVALRGLGGYQLLVDATRDAAVRRLRERKARLEKPLAVLVGDLAAARELAECDPLEETLLASPTGPIVLMRRRRDTHLSPHVHPSLRDVGLMLPTTPLHALLVDRCGPLVATSANREGEPLIYLDRGPDAEEASDLRELADVVISHDRAIERPIDDSVARVIAGRTAVVRVGRGYAPMPLALETSCTALPPWNVIGSRSEAPAIVALGGHQKSAFAYFNGEQAVLGPHIGDLDTEQSRQRYVEQLRGWLALYGGRVAVIAHDAHPDYYTTRLAETWRTSWPDEPHVPCGNAPSGGASSGNATNGDASGGEPRDASGALGESAAIRRVAVQHHHAHVAAAMADHGLLSSEVLGVAWDGTGWGPDGTIWGGEFLVAKSTGYRRVARLRPFGLPGGERAVREPWRTALSLLAQAWNDPLAAAAWLSSRMSAARTAQLPDETAIPPTRASLEACARLATANPGVRVAPWTSSAGRLFDGIAALVFPQAWRPLSYEGQAAAMWESAAIDAGAVADREYALEGDTAVDSPDMWELDWRPMVRAVVRDVERGRAVEAIARSFHAALAEGIGSIAERHPTLPVVLGGGVFQNRLLVEMTAAWFADRGRWLGTPGRIPVNDGGLAAGQLAVALALVAT